VTVLVVGASGLLGGNVVVAARDRGTAVIGTYHTTDPTDGSGPVFDDAAVETTRFDVTADSVTDLDALLAGVDRVVDCAARTDVDACETDPDGARAVNADWPGRLATACAERGLPLCHVSTDYVFDGRDPPYAEADEPNPIQTYGSTKLAGERAVRAARSGSGRDAGSGTGRDTAGGRDALVLRLSFVWGVDRRTDALSGFPAWIAGELRAGRTAPLFADQRVTPTRAGAAAGTALDLLDRGATGTYHVAARDCLTPFAFGHRVAERLGSDAAGRIERSSMADVDRAAARPPETCLDVSAVERELGREQPTLSADLDAVAAYL
jgi:dTDP-4-dehydrorhamnose reductase